MMKLRKKSQLGFTLLEMVLVIAIVVILAVVVWFNVSKYLSAATVATQKVNDHNEYIEKVAAEAWC